MISHLASRRSEPGWWSSDDWKSCLHLAEQVMPRYCQAKLAADEALRREAWKRVDAAAGEPVFAEE